MVRAFEQQAKQRVPCGLGRIQGTAHGHFRPGARVAALLIITT
jgi:hypothetical protein